MTMTIGNRIEVKRQNFGNVYIGRTGTITSIGKGVIPIRVTLDGDNHETDFAKNEIVILPSFSNGGKK